LPAPPRPRANAGAAPPAAPEEVGAPAGAPPPPSAGTRAGDAEREEDALLTAELGALSTLVATDSAEDIHDRDRRVLLQ
jgi:hypothetical protein